jgi:bifunctional UDP-N-acetylglucosamine pyrophosphorylase / glucosamine-1-phosphate N-acetyltransferase
MTVAAVLLAAGHGTRMNSKTQKVLHPVGGLPMIQHVFESAAAVADLPPVVVVGADEVGVRALLGERASYVVQEQRLGTGHATLMAEEILRARADQVIVTYGDMPLLRPDSLRDLVDLQAESAAVIAMLTVLGETSSSFGRVVRAADGDVREIVEIAEARHRPNFAELVAITELNAGVYCFDAAWLWDNLPNLPLRRARTGDEYYLTDMVGLAVEQGCRVVAVVGNDSDEFLGAGTRAELVAVEKAFRRRANRRWLEAGVTLVDPDTTFIDPHVAIGQDTVIWPNCHIQGSSRIGEDCIIGPSTIIRNADVGNRCRIEQAVVDESVVPDGAEVQPFTYLRDSRPDNQQDRN